MGKEDDLMADLAEAMGNDDPVVEVLEGEAPAVEPVDDSTAEPVVDSEPAAEGAGDAEDTLVAAPDDWEADDKALFETLPDNVQRQFLLERARHAAEGAAAAEAEKYKDYPDIQQRSAEMDQVFEPYDQQLALNGMTRGQAVQRLMAAQNYLERDPLAAIQWLAQQYNVTLPTGDDLGNENVDPVVTRLEAQVRQLTESNQMTTQQIQQSQLGALQQQIQEFKARTDASGNPAHPHFDLLHPHMAGLLRSGQAKTLDEAYAAASGQYALAPKPTQLTAEQKQAAVAKAKAASKSIKSSGKPIPAVSNGTISDDLTSAWEEHA